MLKCDYCSKDIEKGFSEWCIFHHRKRRDFCSLECLKKWFFNYLKEEQNKMEQKGWTCSICNKPYETYAVILDDNPLSFTLEFVLRDEYYNEKERKGLCKECRDKVIEGKL